MILTDLARRHLGSAPERTGKEAAAFTERAHLRSVQVVRIFYVISLLWTVESMSAWPGLRAATTINALWPAEWIDLVGLRTGITAILAFYAVASVTVAALPRFRLARIAYTVGLLGYLSLENGFGKVGHGFHGWLWVSAFLVLLPGDRRSWRPDATGEQRRWFLDGFALAQLCLLFFYTLTGFWKVLHATTALFGPGVSGFNLSGFSYIIGANLLATGRETLLGDALVSHPVLGWALFNATMYLEATSLLILVRPRLHRAWGFGLIMFHLGTQAAMGILFPANVVLLGLLLVCSPTAPEEPDLRAAALDLPGVRFAWRLRSRRADASRAKVVTAPSA